MGDWMQELQPELEAEYIFPPSLVKRFFRTPGEKIVKARVLSWFILMEKGRIRRRGSKDGHNNAGRIQIILDERQRITRQSLTLSCSSMTTYWMDSPPEV